MAAATFCVVAAVVLTVFWVRSYRTAERLHGWVSSNRCFLIASKQGRVIATSFPPAFHPSFWTWEVRRYPVDHPRSFPDNSTLKRESHFGFGIIHRSYYSLDQLFGPPQASALLRMPIESEQPQPNNPPVIQAYANFVTLSGTGVIVPYWFLVFFFVANAGVLYRKHPWRFSLRDIFVAVTLIAVLLGLVAVIDN